MNLIRSAIFILTLLISNALLAQMSMEQFLTNQALVSLGEASFQARCSGCHGLNGDASTASPFLQPKPRNLTSGTFKFRSTENGQLPTDADLLRTITQGVLGTSMPSFKFVPEQEKLALIQYLKTLSPVWKERSGVPVPMSFNPPPEGLFTQKAVFLERAKKGREIYAQSCALCHGYDGHGNGPSAASLEDEWGNKIQPLDFAKPFIKSGYGVGDIYRVLKTGLNGTPMPAFAEALGEEKTWDVVSYVMYLRGEAAEIYPVGTIPPIPPPPPATEEE